MTNQEVYENDLNEILERVEKLLRLVPVGSSKKAAETRDWAEALAGDIRSTIFCMKNDYIIKDC